MYRKFSLSTMNICDDIWYLFLFFHFRFCFWIPFLLVPQWLYLFDYFIIFLFIFHIIIWKYFFLSPIPCIDVRNYLMLQIYDSLLSKNIRLKFMVVLRWKVIGRYKQPRFIFFDCTLLSHSRINNTGMLLSWVLVSNK